MKIFIPGSCDIGFLCSNMRIEGNNASYDMVLKTHDFETPVVRHDEKRKVEEVVDKRTWVNENVHIWLVRYPSSVFKHANRM